MRKIAIAAVMSIMASGGAVALSAGPASAEPCGASSYVERGTRYVGYRNCGSSTVTKSARVGGSNYPCYLIRGGSSQELVAVPNGASLSWTVTSC
jgi:hypothetical protein